MRKKPKLWGAIIQAAKKGNVEFEDSWIAQSIRRGQIPPGKVRVELSGRATVQADGKICARGVVRVESQRRMLRKAGIPLAGDVIVSAKTATQRLALSVAEAEDDAESGPRRRT